MSAAARWPQALVDRDSFGELDDRVPGRSARRRESVRSASWHSVGVASADEVFSFPRRHPVLFGMGAVAMVVAWTILIHMFTRDPEPSIEEATVMSFVQSGGRVQSDDLLVAALAGDGGLVDRAMVVAVACHSMLAHQFDVVLEPSVVLATDGGFARVGEMIERGEVSLEQAARYEQRRLAPSGSGSGDLYFERYLEQRAVEASPRSIERFAAYAVNTKTTEWKLVLFDRDAFRPRDVTYFGRTPEVDVLIAGDDEVTVVPTTECDPLVSRS